MWCWLIGHRFDKLSAVHMDTRPWGGQHKKRYYIRLHCVRCGHTRTQYIKPPKIWGTPQTYHHGHNAMRPKRRT